MALPSFLQAMFTPTGPPRQRMDQGGGEYTGFIPGVYEGDDSSPIDFQRSITSRSVSGPTTRRLPNPNATTGTGQTPTQDMMDAVRATGLGGDYDSEGMSSITEVMQATPVGDEFGGAPAMGYATPSDPMGGGLDRMLGDSRFGGGMQTDASPLPSMSMGGYEGEGDLGPDIRRGTVPPHSSAHGFMSGGGFPGSMGPGGLSMGADYGIPSTTRRDPTAAIGDFFGDIWARGTSGERAVPTPGIPPGQTDPALGVPVPMEPHWPEWLRNLFARSTTGGAGRGPRVRR